MSSNIQILPRISPGTNYVPTLAPLVEEQSHKDKDIESQLQKQEDSSVEESSKGEKKSWGKENMYIIIIFWDICNNARTN